MLEAHDLIRIRHVHFWKWIYYVRFPKIPSSIYKKDWTTPCLSQGYTDEPISKILSSMGEAEPVLLDRWELQVEKNPDAPPNGDDSGSHHPSRDTLPLSVVNNYFSFGVDAQIALDFHEARGKSCSF